MFDVAVAEGRDLGARGGAGSPFAAARSTRWGDGESQKFAPPVVPPLAVDRERVIRRLDAATASRVTLVVAPPGYGKSVLLGQWATSLRGSRAAWLTVDAGDNEPVRLASDLCAALGSTRLSRLRLGGDHLGPTHDRLGPAFRSALLDELKEMPPTVLVLDDFHFLTNATLLAELGSILEDAPAQFRMVLAARFDPALPLHRLRMRDELSEVRHQDLAFDHVEAAELVLRLSGHHLADPQTEALLERTEGWVAALQLAALSMRDRADVDPFIDTFAGDDRHVADYLTEQVLRQQPAQVQRFLLRTSVLDRLSASLCNALTGDDDGQPTLDRLDRDSMFLTRLDDRREAFRFHQLFRTLLRHRLRAEMPGIERVLLERAAEWHLARDEVETAVRYLSEAGSWERVVEASFAYGADMYSRGRSLALAGWLEAVPSPVRERSTPIGLLEAAALTMAGETAAAERILRHLDGASSPPAGDRVLADVIRSCSALNGSARPDDAATAASRALDALEALDPAPVPDILGLTATPEAIGMLAHLTRGVALTFQDNVVDARAPLKRVLGHGYGVCEVYALGALALLNVRAGRLRSGEQDGAGALAVAHELGFTAHPGTTVAYLALSVVARERDELERAAILLGEADSRGQSAGAILATLLDIERALLALASGAPEDGLALLRDHRSGEDAPLPAWVSSRRRALEASLSTALGDLSGAARVLAGVTAPTAALAAAELCLAVRRDDLPGARAAEARWPDEEAPRARLERRMWQAILTHLEGETAVARHLMADVVAEAQEEGAVRMFLDAGPQAILLARQLYRVAPTPFLRAIVERSHRTTQARPGRALGEVEQLTGREDRVLAYLPGRMSNTDIAREVGVSVNTVKTHLKNIYRKLGVTGRDEAIATAERAGLL